MATPGGGQQPAERVVLVIVDGVGDVSIPAWGDRTPLEVAHVPYLDAIAGEGSRPSTGLGTGWMAGHHASRLGCSLTA
jgi:2,3-bisphosphoglycerate-independent phosphoglycerate mutase